MFVNAISQTLTSTQKTDAATAVTDLKTIFIWFLNLTPEDRHKVLKMGDKSESFVRGVLEVLKANPSVAGSLDLTEFEKDLKLFDDLREFASLLTPLYEGLNDTMLLLGSELMQQANAGYKLIQEAAKTNPALSTAVEQLGQRYQKQTRGVTNSYTAAPAGKNTLQGVLPGRQMNVLIGGPVAVYRGTEAVGKNLLVSKEQPLEIPSGWTTITVVNMGADVAVYQVMQL